MGILFAKRLGILAIGSLLVLAGCQTSGSSKGESNKTASSSAVEEDSSKTQEQTSESHHHHHHDHDHSHAHDEETEKISEGYFKDSQVKDRSLSDWEGDWQSVYPYLQDGTLDEVFSYKSEHEGDKTAEEYKEYYKKGYKTDVDRILIKQDTVTFFKNGKEYSGKYTYDGYEILTYDAGNRGVRYIFKLAKKLKDFLSIFSLVIIVSIRLKRVITICIGVTTVKLYLMKSKTGLPTTRQKWTDTILPMR